MNKDILDNLDKYKHQLYFFSNDAENIRSYFSGLLFINNNNYSPLNSTMFNYDELAQKIAVLTKKSQNYNLIVKMLKTDDALKIIIALLFKGFSWRNELYEHFNISSNLYVQNTLLTLQNLNLLIKEKGIKLNPYYFEAVENTKDTQIRKSLHQADIYYITDGFVQFCSLLKELFEFKVNDNESFRFSLRQIIDDCKKFKAEYDFVMEEELGLMERKRRSPEGIVYHTKTIKGRMHEKELKKALAEMKFEQLENKEQQNLLTQEESGKLALIRASNNAMVLYQEEENENLLMKVKKLGKPITTYGGKEINFDPLEEIKKQDKEIENAPTIIGIPEMANEPSVYDEGIYLSAAARKEWIELDVKPKTAEEEVEDLFASMGIK